MKAFYMLKPQRLLAVLSTSAALICGNHSFAQCNSANVNTCTGGNITQNFNASNGGFSSSDFTYSSGKWSTPGGRHATYTITSGSYTSNATGGSIGFLTTASNGANLTLTINVLRASDNGVLFSCSSTQAVLPSQVCNQFSGVTPGTVVKYQFVFTTASGSSGDGVIDFDNFSNGGAGAPLPVKMSDFNAVKDGNGIKLAWLTSDELNVRNYQIERSTDGMNFIAIGSIDAGNKKSYSFTDAQPISDNNFYRVKEIDFDGNFSVSIVVAVKSKFSSNIVISPNPIKDKMIIQHPKVEAGAHIQVFNVDGRMMREVSLSPNAVETTVDLSGIQSGLYHVVFKTSNSTISKTVIKQ